MYRFIIAFITTIMISLPAWAQTACATHNDVINKLSRQYSEAPKSIGLANNGNVIEVFSSPYGNTWTMIITTPDGISCLMASGKSWETTPQTASGKGT